MKNLKSSVTISKVLVYYIKMFGYVLLTAITFGLMGYKGLNYKNTFLIENSSLEEMGVLAKFDMSFGQYFTKILLPSLVISFVPMVVLGASFASAAVTLSSGGMNGIGVFPFLLAIFVTIFIGIFADKLMFDAVIESMAIQVVTKEEVIIEIVE